MNSQMNVKKPGQLVEAVNVIPDATIGLQRRPGFELIPWKKLTENLLTYLTLIQTEPGLRWNFPTNVNDDYLYFGCVNTDGSIVIFNQDGQQQAVRYTNEVCFYPAQKYLYNNNGLLEVIDDNG